MVAARQDRSEDSAALYKQSLALPHRPLQLIADGCGVIGLVLIIAIGVGAVLGFSAGWIAAFEVGTSFVTLMMVLVIQHTQGREQAATQRKLDELLRALPEAESRAHDAGRSFDDVMRGVEKDQRESKESASDQ